eukprot:TRINITY_DN12370_c0_g2_i1.p1 TRINITY_DN12370_c0_g2~~TRINITY_DN12370_c0_g2_i1.p1  ORF type:complete len:313 (-),score=41.85 TRINITY_DN12370_c0_g2_i1:78-920(-)
MPSSAVVTAANAASKRGILVSSLLRTQQLVRTVNDLGFVHTHALANSLAAALRERDGQGCNATRQALAEKFNASSVEVRTELTALLASTLHRRTLDELEKSPFWAVLMDETADVRKRSQHGAFVRTLFRATEDSPIEVREHYVACRPLDEAQTGRNIASHIVRVLESAGITREHWNRCVGLCSDGCATMSGEHKGVFSTLRHDMMEYMIWCWCQAHCLNLGLFEAADDHADMVRSRSLVSNTYVFFFRGRGDSSGKIRTTSRTWRERLCRTCWGSAGGSS